MISKNTLTAESTKSIFAARNSSVRYRLIAEAANQFDGMALLRFKGKSIAIVSDPLIARELHTKHAESLTRRSTVNSLLRLVIGDSLLTIDGDQWLSLRQAVNPALSETAVSVYLPELVRLFAARYDRLATRSNTEYVHVSRDDILSNQYAATARIVFGLDFSDPDLRKLVANDLETFRYIGQFKPGSINLPSWMPFSLANRVGQSSSKSTELLLKYNREFHAHRSSEDQDQSILASFNREQATESRCPLRFGRTGEIDLVRTLFYSASVSTAMTLEWALRVLASKRDILDKLTREIDELITDDCDVVDSLPSLHLCRSFILEVTRLYAVIPSVHKTAVADISVSRSVLISRGTLVITSIHGIHTNPWFWDEPLEFRHDRFLKKNYPHEAFWPFSFGAHVCPGKSLALSELVMSLALILRRFKVHEEPDIDFEGACQGVVVVPARSDGYRLVRRH